MLYLSSFLRISAPKPIYVSAFRTFKTTANSTMAQLKVHNSLKPGAPVPFTPKEEGKVAWYACGPTVYDHSHLGHARNYVSTDIIRRIMRDYFGFKVNFVMNITDVDDKIILKARRQRLLELEKSKSYTPEVLSNLATTAFQSYAQGNLPELLKDGFELSPNNYAARRDAVYGKVLAGGTLTGEGRPGDDEAKMKMHLNNLTSAAAAIQENKVLGGADEILLPYLDSLYKDSIDGRDHKIFTDVTKYWEDRFMDDMDALNVMRPEVITRVTEYVPQIVNFVDQIVTKGFAYEADGSVYFDIAAFEKAGNPYARLRPESRNDKALQEDGEGSLSKNLGGKRGAGDFALWKKSKAGEPVWASPWGEGRPGWHIECSVMASDILGSQMDIHSGGIDLAFPHHDNELAQSEAYFCEHGKGPHSWVNYFLHMGHLSIAGSKMSKSLKNFQTIRDALTTDYTPRGMRIVFLLGRWNDGVEISPDMRTMAESWEASLNNFFIVVKSLIAEKIGIFGLDANAKPPYTGLGWANSAASANLSPQETVAPFAAVLQKVKSEVESLALHSEILDKLLAANVDSEFESLATAGSKDPEALVMPYLRTVSRIRDEIRKLAPTSPSKKQILSFSDQIRDDDLTNLGVYLDDRSEGQSALIKFIPKTELLAQREEKAAKEQEKAAQKEAARLAREKIEADKAAKAKVSPVDMFRDERFSAWDEDGLPTKTKEGEDVPKSGLKKMKKDWERQKKVHEEWKAKVKSGI
ncbi:Cysteine--tRNA ligase [Lachnellula cervina]|uniref:cysteine--tRNA ligase n=1 Tax=Lachnellula cervina TaxID=1316786 RepID=A0A7D8UM10_9HELO|nr:Cysteine--tRNA ligase [Lachnellula cervina]